jgi:hypothetical protein
MTMIERRRGEADLAHFHLLMLLKGKRVVVIAAAEKINPTGKEHLLCPLAKVA